MKAGDHQRRTWWIALSFPAEHLSWWTGDDIKLVLISHLVESHTLKLLSVFSVGKVEAFCSCFMNEAQTWVYRTYALHYPETLSFGAHMGDSVSNLAAKRYICRTMFQTWFSSLCSVSTAEDDPCQTNPCLHGGSCLTEGEGYSCLCPQGYSGESCEIGKWIKREVRVGTKEVKDIWRSPQQLWKCSWIYA